MLHPRLKTNYFEKEKWEREWIETAKDILFDQWSTHYQDIETPLALEEPEVSADVSCQILIGIFLILSQVEDEDEDIFASLDDKAMSSKPTEMAAYVREEPIKDDFAKNPIKYWCAKTGDRGARMALDFLSAPGKFLFIYMYLLHY